LTLFKYKHGGKDIYLNLEIVRLILIMDHNMIKIKTDLGTEEIYLISAEMFRLKSILNRNAMQSEGLIG